MIELPDFNRAFEYENAFYLASETSRIGKLLAHYELFQMIKDVPGAIVECGVFKGASLIRFATFRHLFGSSNGKQIIGFDIFGSFPETSFEADVAPRQKFIDSAGDQSISVEQLWGVLEHKHIGENVELVAGDITATVPAYAAQHPELRIALLHIDTDIYEPASVALQHFYPLIAPNGVLVLDDYGTFPGETRAVEEYFEDRPVQLKQFPFNRVPTYLVKP